MRDYPHPQPDDRQLREPAEEESYYSRSLDGAERLYHKAASHFDRQMRDRFEQVFAMLREELQ